MNYEDFLKLHLLLKRICSMTFAVGHCIEKFRTLVVMNRIFIFHARFSSVMYHTDMNRRALFIRKIGPRSVKFSF